jgi:hypothetical protein
MLSRIPPAIALGLVLSTATIDVTGCSSRTTTVTRESDENGKDTTVTSETEEESSGPTGVLSTTVNVIGEIIALPFRIVAGIITFIF